MKSAVPKEKEPIIESFIHAAEREAFPQWELGVRPGPPPERVKWFREKPMSFVGGWEPLSFRTRAGYAWVDEEEAYAREFSDEALESYVKLGANSIVIPYAKGFGLAATPAEIAHEKDIIRRAHRLGLRVAVYVRTDAIVPETVYHDRPEVGQWLVQGMNGKSSFYHPQQSFRKQVCYSHPGAVEYLESILRFAVEEMGADQIHMDGFHVAFLPAQTCRCDLCLASYRKWLGTRYPDDAARAKAFGVLDAERAQMPEFGAALPPFINSQDMRSWFRFQWERELTFMRHVRRYVRGLSEDVAISINAMQGVLENMAVTYSQRGLSLLPWVDAFWWEDLFHVDHCDVADFSRLAVFKLAREHGVPVCCYHWKGGDEGIRASLAFSLAINGGNPSCLGFTFRFLPHATLAAAAKGELCAWAESFWPKLRDARPDADLAIIRHHPSMAWNGVHPWQAAGTMEALLAQMQVPWRTTERLDPTVLDSLRTVLLPDMESLSDEELALLKSWVERGGRLFFTTRTARYNEDRRRRPRHPILDWVSDWREVNDRIGPEDWLEWLTEDNIELHHLHGRAGGAENATSARLAKLGAGVVGWWPRLEYEIALQPHQLSLKNLTPPLRARELEEFLRELHGPFRVTLEGAESVMLEASRVPATGERLIHLIRIGVADDPIDFEIRLDGECAAVSCATPDEPGCKVVTGETGIRVEGFRRVAVIVLPG